VRVLSAVLVVGRSITDLLSIFLKGTAVLFLRAI
jgi:hypothetical protein